MRVRSLHREEPLEEGTATRSSILARGIPRDRGAWQAVVRMAADCQTQLKRRSTMGVKWYRTVVLICIP